jgi:hypothetical protein
MLLDDQYLLVKPVADVYFSLGLGELQLLFQQRLMVGGMR